MNEPDSAGPRFGHDGLIPVVAQDADSGNVLMLAFMNREALERTQSTGLAHYWSRSRQQLWLKGETSGNVQQVTEILVNCEENSLLLKVHQVGAVCHTGYPTCFYRALGDDGELTVVRERVFDPATVYDNPTNPLIDATRLQFGAYAHLREHNLEAESQTSRRLRHGNDGGRERIADELIELAGVLTGEHRHDDPASDLRLEASQVIYWLLLEAIAAGARWETLRPDRALATGDAEMPLATVAGLLRREAEAWRAQPRPEADAIARLHATLALVAQACRSGGIEPLSAIEADLATLRSRPYLAPYFAGGAAA